MSAGREATVYPHNCRALESQSKFITLKFEGMLECILVFMALYECTRVSTYKTTTIVILGIPFRTRICRKFFTWKMNTIRILFPFVKTSKHNFLLLERLHSFCVVFYSLSYIFLAILPPSSQDMFHIVAFEPIQRHKEIFHDDIVKLSPQPAKGMLSLLDKSCVS